MKKLKQFWYWIVVQPLFWLYYSVFRPKAAREFENEIDVQIGNKFLKRLVRVIQPIPLLFFLAFPVALLLRAIWLRFSFDGEAGNFLFTVFLHTIAGIVVGIAVGSMKGFLGGLIGGFMGAIAGAIVLGPVGSIVFGVMFFIAGYGVVGIIARLIGALFLGILFGNITYTGKISSDILVSSLVFIFYMLLYFRLIPFYLYEIFSLRRVYRISRKDPTRVFTQLQKSAIYRDDRVYLPLPYLKQILLIAFNQDIGRTLKEIAYIVAVQPGQMRVVREVALEIAIHDLEQRHSVEKIAGASQRLSEVLPAETGIVDSRWARAFIHLKDASKDADRYYNLNSPQKKYEALRALITDLEKVHPYATFEDVQFKKRFAQVIDDWQTIAQRELEGMGKVSFEIGQLPNPFKAGQVLNLEDPFVGREDLVQQLEQALSRRSDRPTFMLSGERRMGKTSALLQLPKMLGSRYVPIFYNLQAPTATSSAANLLGTIADGIQKALTSRDLPVRRLNLERLQRADQINEAVLYAVFEEWLKEIEVMLEEEDRILLLTFDEFEALEDAWKSKQLNLRLLLSWFRTVIQYQPRLALLFSGSRILGEINPIWVEHFVNVQTLRVSFLEPNEAQRLILKPTADFPGEEIFPAEVVQQIINETGCHPFLIQAVCTLLIYHLNTKKRDRAELEDVPKAVDETLEKWGETYFRELWNRTSHEQRTCLLALKTLNKGDMQTIQQQCGLDEPLVHRALQILLKRDLVLQEKGRYRIAAPMFEKWVEYNKYE